MITFYCYVLILDITKSITSNKMFFWHVSRFGAFQTKKSIKNINDNNDNNFFSFHYTRPKSSLQVQVNLLYFQIVSVYTTYGIEDIKLGYPFCKVWFVLN